MDEREVITRSYYHGKDKKKEFTPEEAQRITEKLRLYSEAYKKVLHAKDSKPVTERTADLTKAAEK